MSDCGVVDGSPQEGQEEGPDDDAAVVAKMQWKLLPMLTLCYLCGQIDRSNVGFAATPKGGMLESLAMSKAQYGFGSGLFFAGYIMMQAPGNIILDRIGGPLWLGMTVMVWGAVAALNAAATTKGGFYAVRLALGLAEAGFAPGALLYLSRWFRKEERARIFSIFFLASPVAGIISSPFCGAVLDLLSDTWGIEGWRWIFLLQGVPVCFVGAACCTVLPASPEEAVWLTSEERATLTRFSDNGASPGHVDGGWVAQVSAIATRRVVFLGLLSFVSIMLSYGITMWLPLTVTALFPHATGTVIGCITMIPYVSSFVSMLLVGHYCSHHVALHGALLTGVLMAISGACLVASGLLLHRIATIALLSLAMGAIAAASVVFYSWVTILLREEQRAVGIAVVNSIGHVGGFCGPYAYGLSHTKAVGLAVLGTPAILAGMVLLTLAATLAVPLAAEEDEGATPTEEARAREVYEGGAKAEPLLAGRSGGYADG